MIRVVIDTNVFVSSFFGGVPRQIINRWRDGELLLCLSQEIIEEYIAVLCRMGLQQQKELDRLTRLFAEGYNSIFCAHPPRLEIVDEDPDDNKFIECAVALESKFIISGDKHLRNIGKYIDIRIVSPREFVELQIDKQNHGGAKNLPL